MGGYHNKTIFQVRNIYLSFVKLGKCGVLCRGYGICLVFLQENVWIQKIFTFDWNQNCYSPTLPIQLRQLLAVLVLGDRGCLVYICSKLSLLPIENRKSFHLSVS